MRTEKRVCRRCGKVYEYKKPRSRRRKDLYDFLKRRYCNDCIKKRRVCENCGRTYWITVPDNPLNQRLCVPCMHKRNICANCGKEFFKSKSDDDYTEWNEAFCDNCIEKHNYDTEKLQKRIFEIVPDDTPLDIKIGHGLIYLLIFLMFIIGTVGAIIT